MKTDFVKYHLCDYTNRKSLILYMKIGDAFIGGNIIVRDSEMNSLKVKCVRFTFGEKKHLALIEFIGSTIVHNYDVVGIEVEKIE